MNPLIVTLVMSFALMGCPGPDARSTPRKELRPPPSLLTIDFDLVAKIERASDTPSPTWSPSGRAVVYTGDYVPGPSRRQLFLYNLLHAQNQMVYDPSLHGRHKDSIYVVYRPAFIDESRVIVSEALSENKPEEFAEIISLVGAATIGAGVRGYAIRPAPLQEGEAVSGSLLFSRTYPDTVLLRKGQEQLFQGLHSSLLPWSPDGERILGWSVDTAEVHLEIVSASDGTRQRFESWSLGANGTDSPSPDNYQLRWAPNGQDVLFVSNSDAPSHFFDPREGYGTLMLWEAESDETRVVAPKARNPVALPKTRFVFFDSPEGLAITDLDDVVVLDDEVRTLTEVRPSPDGRYLVGLSAGGGAAFDLVIYAVSY